MYELLKALMNNGLFIYEAGAKVVLKKLPTPENPSPAIRDDHVPDASVLEFDSFELALEKAKDIIGWGKQEQPRETLWAVQMRYSHRGLGYKVATLDDVLAESHVVAKSMAKEMAAKYICENLEEDLIENWEIQVRPAHPVRQTF